MGRAFWAVLVPELDISLRVSQRVGFVHCGRRGDTARGIDAGAQLDGMGRAGGPLLGRGPLWTPVWAGPRGNAGEIEAAGLGNPAGDAQNG